MSKRIQICLTNLNSYPGLTGPFIVYSDLDTINPIESQITLDSVTEPNCPYRVDVPDGTTSIRLRDTNTGCYCTIPIQDNDICEICSFDFDLYSASTVGRLSVGNLTGSCETPISSYKINWYGPSETSVFSNSLPLSFTSGYGSEFSGYSFTHPILNDSAIPLEEGYYFPIISNLYYDGKKFSYNNETPGEIDAYLDCLSGIQVSISAYTCDNGNYPTEKYTHQLSFVANGFNAPAKGVAATFKLSGNTNFFAWSFDAVTITDEFKLTYYGDAYQRPIVLDWWNMGSGLYPYPGNVWTPYDIPNTNYWGPFRKIVTLTGLTRSANDRLLIEVIPNSGNSQTNWYLNFACLDTIDCYSCNNDYLNESLKIIESSIINSPIVCSAKTISFQVSGCSGSPPQTLVDYTNSTFDFNTSSVSLEFKYNVRGCEYVITPFGVGNSCAPQDGGNITLTKTNTGVGGTGIITLQFDNINDYNFYHDKLEYIRSFFTTSVPDTEVGYYKEWGFVFPSNITGSDLCGDNTQYRQISISQHSNITYSSTGGTYTIQITMPNMVRHIEFTGGTDVCSSGTCYNTIDTIVSSVNNNTYTSPFSYSWSIGTKCEEPFNYIKGVNFVDYPNLIPDAQITTKKSSIIKQQVTTYPFYSDSFGNNESIPNLVSIVCPDLPTLYPRDDDGTTYNQYHSSFYVVLHNAPSNYDDFKIFGKEVSNGMPLYYWNLAYTFEGGVATYVNPYYII